MRRTLQRSCASCAKAKHRCDLQTPKCSRCIHRGVKCLYINQPLSQLRTSKSPSNQLSYFGAQSIDPFDTYPRTSLPRQRVQHLIHHFMTKIAFQYYPLDCDPTSNPFIISWWPLALTDAALFHVSLQTACLDDELQAQKGFQQSQLLMRDAISLLRQKVEDPLLAFQDAMMNAVITLAAIEHGKGNLEVSHMHVEAVKRMVRVRGGVAAVKRTSPLTARMVPWVSLLVMGHPQFETQDLNGFGDGIAPPPQWMAGSLVESERCSPYLVSIHPDLANLHTNLQVIFRDHRRLNTPHKPGIMSTTDLHDLTCFVLHRLLQSPSSNAEESSISKSVRCATTIYMILLHGSTYYSHAELLGNLVISLKHLLETLPSISNTAWIWLCTLGLTASLNPELKDWFSARVRDSLVINGHMSWEEVKPMLKCILWLDDRCESIFRQAWDQAFTSDMSNLG